MSFNETEIRKAIEQFHPEVQLFEIRVLLPNKKTVSGYFTEANTLIEKLKTVDTERSNVYMTIQQVNNDCYSRMQRNTFLQNVNTTSDTDIDGYNWLFIDLDPIRKTGISSSKDELTHAVNLANKIKKYLSDLGFESPVVAASGNGVHLMYKVILNNNEQNQSLIERCLKSLAYMFDNEFVNVDTTTYNPSRICKLYGTVARKGSHTTERPHRQSKIIGDKKEVKATSKVFLEKLAQQLPTEKIKPTKYNGYNVESFDIESWLSKYGIGYKPQTGKLDCRMIYRLNECPFDPSHKDGDSKVFLYNNGAIAFKCHHNSCNQYRWQDVRLKFEPEAYSDREELDSEIDAGWKEHNRNKSSDSFNYVHPVSPDVDEPMFLTPKMILDKPEPEEEFIRSGIEIIDKKMKGLKKTFVTVISGLRGGSKSTLMNQIALNAVNEGNTVIYYSGELTSKRLMGWINMSAAGKQHVVELSEKGFYGVPKKIKEDIAYWLGDKLWIYNNNYGNNFKNISQKLRNIAIDKKADLIIIDNLMALDLREYDKNDKYEAQTQFVWDLKQLAADTNTHIIFVAHPRKAQGFLRLNDISGSGNIVNIVDNAFVIHRNNQDFEKGFAEFYKKPSPDGTNIIEIAKDRDYGCQDEFISLWYEKTSKRLLNNPSEHIVYGWEGNDGFVSVDDELDLPFEL